MAQSLEVNIKATSDVPQAVDKAKAAMTGFDKQVQEIGKKFSNSFKDIFLSFLGPMAILTTVLAFIGKMIADNQKKHEDANQAAIDGTNELMSAEDRYYTNKLNNEKKAKEKVEQAKVTREDVTEEFLRTDPRGRALVENKPGPATSFNKGANDLLKVVTLGGDVQGLADAAKRKSMANRKDVQDYVQSLIAEDAAKNPPPATAPTGPTSFKAPEGFGNIVGVGANPVMEAMTLQLDEARKQTALLENISRGSGGGVPVDFTKTPTPSRASLLQGGK
jgi:hypothetical protein